MKKNKLILLFGAFVFVAPLFGCYDVIEQDLADQKINLIAPYDSAVVSDPLVTFWWSKVEYIDGYRVQVVKPSFKKIEKIEIDSVVLKENFNIQIPVGSYQWRVVAQNSGYELVSDTFNIQVVAVPN